MPEFRASGDPGAAMRQQLVKFRIEWNDSGMRWRRPGADLGATAGEVIDTLREQWARIGQLDIRDLTAAVLRHLDAQRW